jgi:hypothetical protein
VLGSTLAWIESIAFSSAGQTHPCLLVLHVIMRSDATIVTTAWTHLLTVSSNSVFNFNLLGGVPFGRWIVGTFHHCPSAHCRVPVAVPVVLLRIFAIYDFL